MSRINKHDIPNTLQCAPVATVSTTTLVYLETAAKTLIMQVVLILGIYSPTSTLKCRTYFPTVSELTSRTLLIGRMIFSHPGYDVPQLKTYGNPINVTRANRHISFVPDSLVVTKVAQRSNPGDIPLRSPPVIRNRDTKPARQM